MAFERKMISIFERLPKISFYARTRGWHFVLAWCHRITGILLVVLVWFHIFFFSSTYGPGGAHVKSQGFGSLAFSLLRWILAIPIIFHAFNGGRLILYEIYMNRDEGIMLRWMAGLSILYLGILGLLMLMHNQTVSPFVYWLAMTVGGLVLAYGLGAKIWKLGHSFFWTSQRLIAVFLIVMIPGYLLFMPLNPAAGLVPGPVIKGIQRYFVQTVYLGLLVVTLYHGGYGIWSLVSDYLSSRFLRTGLALMVMLLMLILCLLGVRAVLGI